MALSQTDAAMLERIAGASASPHAEALCAVAGRVRESFALREELLAALQDAVSAVKVFHGPVAWETYWNHSPEAKRWRAAIAKAGQGQ